MGSKRGVYIIVTVVIALLIGTLWVYDSFISPKSKNIKIVSNDTLLQDYFKETLMPDYVPGTLSVEVAQITTANTFSYTHTANWMVGETQFSAFVNESQDSEIEFARISVFVEGNDASDQNSMQQVVSRYFKSVGELSCGNSSGRYICVNVSDNGAGLEAIHNLAGKNVLLNSWAR